MTARATVAVPEEVSVPMHELQRPEPCTLIIFGAGDLLHRKLMPSLFHLMGDGLLPDEFAIITVAREALDEEAFRTRVADGLKTFAPNGTAPDPRAWSRFAPHLHYISGELGDPATYEALREQLAETDARLPGASGRLFYLAIPPSLYVEAINRLAESGIAPRVPDPKQRPWVRIIIEKPFGRSLGSAGALNACVRHAFAEHQVYRIDHYLGKETVQNLLVFRFANSIFEPVCNRQHVHHVQITVAESVGVEHRGKYYEEAGVVRDMFQNHLLQLLTMVAMEPPVTFSADAVRDEKVKVLR
ncbi:MAG TPA: glucose-6-phosphate dehydrogenase, partial [Gemmatimonadales bacterium]